MQSRHPAHLLSMPCLALAAALLSSPEPRTQAFSDTIRFRSGRAANLPDELSGSDTVWVAGDLDGDGDEDAVVANDAHVGILMSPGRYSIHETLPGVALPVRALAVFDNHVDRTGSTLMTVEDGLVATYRYVAGPTPSMSRALTTIQSNAQDIVTWSGAWNGMPIGFVALVEPSSVRLLAFYQATGAYLTEVYTIPNLPTDHVALVDRDGDGLPELAAFTSMGLLLFDSAGAIASIVFGDYSGITGLELVRTAGLQTGPVPEVLAWSRVVDGALRVTTLGSAGLATTQIEGLAKGGIERFDAPGATGLTGLLALGDNGSWALGSVNASGATAWQPGPEALAFPAQLRGGGPLVRDWDSDGDSDLLTFSADLANGDGDDLIVWENARIDAASRSTGPSALEFVGIGGSIPGDDQENGPAVFAAGGPTTAKLSLPPPPELDELAATHISVRVWTGANGIDGIKEALVLPDYLEAVQPLVGGWTPTAPLDFPNPAAPIVEELSSDGFSSDLWVLDLEIPSPAPIYLEVRCLTAPDTEDAVVHPSQFYVIVFQETDAVVLPPLLPPSAPIGSIVWWMQYYHGALLSEPIPTVVDFREEPQPYVFELTGLTLEICGYPASSL